MTPSTRRTQSVDTSEEDRYLALFQGGNDSKLVELIDGVSQSFLEDTSFCRPGITEHDLARRFMNADMPEESEDVLEYARGLVQNVVDDSIHTSSPQMIGHMTSALPTHMQQLSKLMVAMNQNVVKTETAKSVTFLEREALAKLHKLLYKNTAEFYAENMQRPDVMLGLFTSGGTLANLSALWLARNSRLGPDGDFEGVNGEGLLRAMRHYGYLDAVVVGSALMHYSMDKAADLLGVGVKGLVKIRVDSNYQVDLEKMENYLIHAQENRILVLAIVGICGATETGAIDPLWQMAELASKYKVHFHVDAAWGGPCIFSESHKSKARGMELADTITLDGHKQLWLPMGCGLVFMKDPALSGAIRKTANYIIRKDSYDLGKFTIEGSRGAQAIYLHANLQTLGIRGYEVLFDRTARVAKYMARCILRSTNFELLVKPMTNILLYRWIPAHLRLTDADALTDAENAHIDECNRQLQDLQKQKGVTFVSRTTINCPKYDFKPIVALRVVIGNPLTHEDDIDAVFGDQDSIIMGGSFMGVCTSNPAVIVDRLVKSASSESVDALTDQHSPRETSKTSFKSHWEAVWEQMSASDRFLFNDDIGVFFDGLATPDCFMGQDVNKLKLKVIKKATSSYSLRSGSSSDGLTGLTDSTDCDTSVSTDSPGLTDSPWI